MCGVVSYILALSSLLISGVSFSQETARDWSKIVIEWEGREGQNFEQDLLLVRAYLHLQRREDAQGLILKLMAAKGRKEPRLQELYETASDQFFTQEAAEAYALAVQLIQESNWQEAREKIDSVLPKEKRHRLLILRSIQLGLILESKQGLQESLKAAELGFPDSPVLRIYKAWLEILKGNTKEAARNLASMSEADRKVYENSELYQWIHCRLTELGKKADGKTIARKIKDHPEWISLRLWRLKNMNLNPRERKQEMESIQKFLDDPKRTASLWSAEDKRFSSFFSGLIQREKFGAQLEELVK